MDEALIETSIGSEKIFDGTLLHVRRDTVKLPNGNTATREWIKHPGASSVIPLLEDGTMLSAGMNKFGQLGRTAPYNGDAALGLVDVNLSGK